MTMREGKEKKGKNRSRNSINNDEVKVERIDEIKKIMYEEDRKKSNIIVRHLKFNKKKKKQL